MCMEGWMGTCEGRGAASVHGGSNVHIGALHVIQAIPRVGQSVIQQLTMCVTD